MSSRLLFTLGIFALALSTALLKPEAIVGLQQAPTAGQTLRGTVTRAGTSEGIPDVQISLNTLDGLRGQSMQTIQALVDQLRSTGATVPPGLLAQLDQARGASTQVAIEIMATSDREGHFAFPNLPAGQYTIQAQREGYFGQGSQGSYPTIANARVTIATAQPADFTLFMIPAAAIGGRALDADGKPIVGARVQVARLNYQNGAPVLQNVATNSMTDDRGNYRVFRIPPGEYYLSVTPATANNFNLGARGRGAPAAPKEELVRTFYPDALDAASARKITIRGGEDLSNTAVTVRKLRTVSVSGNIVSTINLPVRQNARGTALPSVQLQIMPHDRNAISDQTFTNYGSATMDGLTSGRFELSSIAPGSYDLIARTANILLDAAADSTEPQAYFGRVSFTAGFENVQGLSVVIHQPVEVKGYATVDGSAAAASGAVTVSLQPDDSARFIGLNLGARGGVAGVDGSFSIPFVYEGIHRVQASVGVIAAANPAGAARGGRVVMAARGGYVQDIREGGVSVYDDGLKVGTEPPHLLEILVKTDGGSVSGDVYDSKQQLKSGATVVLIPPEQHRQNPNLYKSGTSNAMGHFAFNGVPPGQYKLFAWEDIANGKYYNPAFLKTQEERGTSVFVTAGNASTVQLTAIPQEK